MLSGELENRAGVLERHVIERVVDDVLAEPLVAVALRWMIVVSRSNSLPGGWNSRP